MTDNKMRLLFEEQLKVNYYRNYPTEFMAEHLAKQFIYNMIKQTRNIPQPLRVTKEVLNELKLERLLSEV